jgi:hypothetical protein
MEGAPVAVGEPVLLTHPAFQRMNQWYADRNKCQAWKIRIAARMVLPRMFRPLVLCIAGRNDNEPDGKQRLRPGSTAISAAFQGIAAARAADDRHTPRSAPAMHLLASIDPVTTGVPA